MFELLSRIYPEEKQKPVSQKIKKPVANTNKKKWNFNENALNILLLIQQE